MVRTLQLMMIVPQTMNINLKVSVFSGLQDRLNPPLPEKNRYVQLKINMDRFLPIDIIEE